MFTSFQQGQEQKLPPLQMSRFHFPQKARTAYGAANREGTLLTLGQEKSELRCAHANPSVSHTHAHRRAHIPVSTKQGPSPPLVRLSLQLCRWLANQVRKRKLLFWAQYFMTQYKYKPFPPERFIFTCQDYHKRNYKQLKKYKTFSRSPEK